MDEDNIERLESVLTQLVASITPEGTEFLQGKVLAGRIFQVLKEYLANVGLTAMVGEMGRNTAIKHGSYKTDYNLVLCVEKGEVPAGSREDFSEYLVRLKKSIITILGSVPDFGVYEKPPNRKGAIAIEAKNDQISFDLVIGVLHSLDDDRQVRATIEQIRALAGPDDMYLHTPGLDYPYSMFFRGQSDFVLDVIRLAKYWDRVTDPAPGTSLARSQSSPAGVGQFTADRTFLIETIALKAALWAEKNGPSLLGAFCRFLKHVSGLKKLKVVFTVFYEKDDIPECLLNQRPLVLDVCNPFNNLADLGPENVERLVSRAQTTAARINQLKKQSEDEIKLETLFKAEVRKGSTGTPLQPRQVNRRKISRKIHD